jgi:hypothetical protein
VSSTHSLSSIPPSFSNFPRLSDLASHDDSEESLFSKKFKSRIKFPYDEYTDNFRKFDDDDDKGQPPARINIIKRPTTRIPKAITKISDIKRPEI